MSAPNNLDLMDAILGLREATELGFANAARDVDRRFDEMDERWHRRFMALETRVEVGFQGVDRRLTAVDARFDAVDARFNAVDARFNAVDARFDDVDARFDDVDHRFTEVNFQLAELRTSRL
jgi:septation ring formation regulator EzrA